MIDDIKNYYVYLHITPDGMPFYVGKGKGNRAFVKSKRSVFWKSIVNKYGYNVLFLEENLTNDESIIIERNYINLFGRRDKNTGTLVNFTDGGDGGSLGQVMTEDRRTKHQKALKGKTYVEIYGEDRAKEMIESRKKQKGIPKPKVSLTKIGKKRSEETKNKISESLKGRPSTLKGEIREEYRKPVYQISIDGDIIKEWSSIKEVYECLNIQISRALKFNKTCNGFYWKYKNYQKINEEKMYNLEQIKNAVLKKNYVWFEDANNKGYDVNIVGVRNSAPGNKVTNVFDDTLTVSYKVNGEWVFKQWPATTDPGKKGVMEYHNAAGVARLVPGQYRKSHTIGLHQGKYEALKQASPVKVYRDANKDMVYDTNKITEGVYGINIHKAGADSTYVENWSEGCQVFKKEADFNEFMKICKEASKIHGEFFSYTLIESKDITA